MKEYCVMQIIKQLNERILVMLIIKQLNNKNTVLC